jgi:flagella basal body P-ring formation protein FlgA
MKWWLALLWLCCGAACAAAVELHASALVRGRVVTLGDVARIDGDGAAARALAAARIGNAPLAGYTEEYSRAAIEMALRAQPATAALRIDWRGAERVMVRRATKVVAGAELNDVARQRIAALHGVAYERLELTPLGAPADVQVPEGDVVLRAREVPVTLRQRTAVWVDVLVDGAVYRSVTVPFQVQAWSSVLVARRALARDTQATQADFDVARRDVLGLAAAAAAVPERWSGLRLKEALDEGQVLLRTHVVPAGSVRRGDRLTLVVDEGGVRIESAAVAQDDGATGALVRVKPAGSTETVAARVVAAGVVAIEGH